MRLAARVLGTMQRQALVPTGASVLVALSGGSDSVALLLLMQSLHERGGVVLAGAAHLNHQLRGAESDDDESFCRALAERVGVKFISERMDVAALARNERRSLEDAARRARYAFLDRAADLLNADLVATGHTRDDQAETFLLRILRGAGTRGLGGIRPRRGRVIRPLLNETRGDLREFVAALGETFREDATNADVRVPRNRVRHELIPLLQSQLSPGVVDVLAREAELARRDEDFLRQQAIDLARRIVLSENDSEIRVAAAPLDAAHPALSSRVAQVLLERFAARRASNDPRIPGSLQSTDPRIPGSLQSKDPRIPGSLQIDPRIPGSLQIDPRIPGSLQIGFDHVQRLLELAGRASDGALAMPGQEAIRVGSEIVLRRAARVSGTVNSFVFPLSIPGEVHSGGWVIAAVPAEPGADRRIWAARGNEVGIEAGRVALPLAVRNRRPGDRFRPLGAPGKRKLQDFLVDRKVPRARRDALPLVVDGRDRIVWVPGQSVADEFKVSHPSQAVILLRVRRLGGE